MRALDLFALIRGVTATMDMEYCDCPECSNPFAQQYKGSDIFCGVCNVIYTTKEEEECPSTTPE
jgi:uncharacterized Zn finger protein (UPF0148 family)